MISRSVKSALLCLCVSSAFVCAAPAYAAGAQEAGTVSVSGYAEEQITPDTAYITIGMTTDGKTSEEARMKNNAVMNEVQQAALAMGIEKKDMKTRGYNVYPTYGSNQKITGYSVSNNLELKVSDFDLIPRLIAAPMKCTECVSLTNTPIRSAATSSNRRFITAGKRLRP